MLAPDFHEYNSPANSIAITDGEGEGEGRGGVQQVLSMSWHKLYQVTRSVIARMASKEAAITSLPSPSVMPDLGLGVPGCTSHP